MTSLEHPPYSPGLAPADFYLFPQLKLKLKERRFCDDTDIIKNVTEKLKRLSQNGFRNVSNTSTVVCRSVYLHKGAILKEMKLK